VFRLFPLPRLRALGPAVVLAVLGLTACSPAVNVDSAPDAANPDCATVLVAVPPELAGHALRETTSQGTAAWGDPSAVILRCGVSPGGPTSDGCASVNRVDWVLREGEQMWTATAFGRQPGIEVVFDPQRAASSTVLVELGPAVAQLEQNRKCLGPTDVLDIAER
jgi:hypothetical protein